MPSIDILVDPTREFLHQVAALLPRLVLALAVVVAGWLLAKIIRFAIERGLRAVNFNVLTQRAGTDHFLQSAGLRGDTTTLFGLLGYWLILIAALMAAFNGLQLTYVTDLLQRVELFGPKVLVAGLVMVLGSYFARFIGDSIERFCRDAHIADGDILSKIVRYLIMAFVIMIALSQIEVGGDLVQRAFLIVLAGVVLALALAFGLGGKEWAAALLERWWPRSK
jgi:small-conductance mechanosensitive channel